MNEPLRPSTLGEILDRTAQLYRTRFMVYLGIAMFPAIAEFVPVYFVYCVVALHDKIRVPFVSANTELTLFRFFLISIVVVAPLVWLAVTALATAAMNHTASRQYLGEALTIREAYKHIRLRRWCYTGLYLLLALFIGIIPLAVRFTRLPLGSFAATMSAKVGMGGGEGSFLVSMMAILLIIVLAGFVIWLSVHLSLAFPACVVEQSGVWPAIKRSWTLSKGTKGRIFFLFLLVGILGLVLWATIGFSFLTLLTTFPRQKLVQYIDITALFSLFVAFGAPVAAQALIKPIYTIALMLFYYDQRIRKEGYDIERMMEAAGLNAPVISPSEESPIAPGAPQEGPA